MIKKVFGSITVFGGMFLLFASPVISNADSLDEIITIGGSEVIEPLIPNSELEIFPEVQARIDDYVSESAGNEEVINAIIENCKLSGVVSSEEMNQNLTDFIRSATVDPQDLERAILSAEELVNNDKISSSSKNARAAVDPIQAARSAWNIGIAAVKAAGYPNTAMYMKYSEVPNFLSPAPKKHVSNNNAWAKSVITGDDILNDFYSSKYKPWVRSNKKTLSVSGSFVFTTGDKHYALNKVNYSYSFVRQANGSVKRVGVVTDTYDFALSGYQSIPTGIANNYAVAMQTLGLIKPYPIEIKYSL
ncbi:MULTISPECIES: hypothetical protein [Enterococcus]|uniref:hypothetical protein n=1 Tax=Enterococcus TaxID=1350 RepID=UPI002647A5D3|nr:hypothetical protein [Enterococcus entomosocium]